MSCPECGRNSQGDVYCYACEKLYGTPRIPLLPGMNVKGIKTYFYDILLYSTMDNKELFRCAALGWWYEAKHDLESLLSTRKPVSTADKIQSQILEINSTIRAWREW